MSAPVDDTRHAPRYRRRVVSIRLCLILPLAASCSSDAAPTKDKPDTTPTGKVAGVFPDKFECTTIISNDTLAQTLGGNVRRIDGPIQMTRGLPKPCSYEVMT